MTSCRGIRGAITVPENTREEILQATDELLRQIIDANDVHEHEVAAMLFTTTVDLNAEFPAVAARAQGWDRVALMCSHEMVVPNSLSKCVRVLILVNTEKTEKELVHVYLRDAKALRADLATED